MKKFFNNPDFGLLFLRLGLGVFLISHGVMKLMGGKDMMTNIGQAMSVYSITAFPLFWGLLAALSETIGGLCLILGFQVRIASFFVAGTMFTAFMVHFTAGDSFLKYAWSAEMCIVFISLMFIGAGKYSIDKT
jgi:putative oxidoreductase